MYSYKLNNSYTVYVNYYYLNDCIKASRKCRANNRQKKATTMSTTIVTKKTVKVGSEVSVLNLDTQKENVFKLTYSENINLEKGMISDTSPVGRALMGHSIGEIITVQVPAGVVRYQVLNLKS